MRHHNANRKFGRVASQRRALLNSLARSLVLHGSIETTEAKAKELRPFVEKLVTAGRVSTLAVRRRIGAVVGTEAASKILTDISPKYAKRAGGYLRIVRVGVRASSAASMARIAFV